jgi:hypothetical protein
MSVLEKFGDAIRNLQTDTNAPVGDIELVYNLLGMNKPSEKPEKTRENFSQPSGAVGTCKRHSIWRDLKVAVFVAIFYLILRSKAIMGLMNAISPKPAMNTITMVAALIIITVIIQRAF